MFAATKGSGLSTKTVTFTASGTWVAPRTTNLVVSASGYGGPAVSDTQMVTDLVASSASKVSTTQANAPYAQWSDIEAGLDPAIALVAANTGTNLLTLPRPRYSVAPDNTWSMVTDYFDLWIVGNSYTKKTIDSPGTGNVLYSAIGPVATGWYIEGTRRILGNVGASATALGKTFSGGTLSGTEPYRTAVSATTTTFNTIPVTPGASYSIVVPSGGSVTITYIG